MSQKTGDTPSGAVLVIWDIENCAVSKSVEPVVAVQKVKQFMRRYGRVTELRAFGDMRTLSPATRASLQGIGVSLLDVPNNRKEAADKAILVDLFCWALEHAPPATIVLISSDRDFSVALSRLADRQYTIVLVHAAVMERGSKRANPAAAAAEEVWDWPTVQGVGDADSVSAATGRKRCRKNTNNQDAAGAPLPGGAPAEEAKAAATVPPPQRSAGAPEKVEPPSAGRRRCLYIKGPRAKLDDLSRRGFNDLRDLVRHVLYVKRPPSTVPHLPRGAVLKSALVEAARELTGCPNMFVEPAAAAKAGLVHLGGSKPNDWVKIKAASDEPPPASDEPPPGAYDAGDGDDDDTTNTAFFTDDDDGDGDGDGDGDRTTNTAVLSDDDGDGDGAARGSRGDERRNGCVDGNAQPFRRELGVGPLARTVRPPLGGRGGPRADQRRPRSPAGRRRSRGRRENDRT